MDDEHLNPPELGRKAKQPPDFAALVVKWVLILGALTAFLMHHLKARQDAPGQLTACRSNLRNVAAAVEMYAHEHQGRYPDRLEQVYAGVSLIPSCPAAGRVTFTDYQVSPNGDNFSFSCVGDNHRLRYGRSAPNCPSYSASGGLAEPYIP